VGLVIALPFIIIGQDSVRSVVSYHALRGLQIESTYGSFLLMGDELGLSPMRLVYNFGSWNITGSTANALAAVSNYILAVLLIIAYVFIYKQMKPGKSQFTRLGAYSVLAVAIVLVTSKVLSPQYLIWLVPLVPLVFNRWRYWLIIVFIAIGGLTYYIFPWNYLELIARSTGVIVALLVRNLLLLLLMVLTIVNLRRMKASD
jgi:hypothetical protein